MTTACFPSANESQKQLNALITLDFSPKRLDGSLLLETGREAVSIGACTHELKGRGLDVQYFSPMQIKMAITGIGRADKNQVQQMVALLLKMDKVPRPDHAADALADCITYAVMNQTKGRLGGILK